jgi:signal transduction histidine kinase
MMSISEGIVSINNVVANQSKILIENLLEMDANAKKYSLLKKSVYKEYFETARTNFNTSLLTINHLKARDYTAPAVFSLFLDEYTEHIDAMTTNSTEHPDQIYWVDEDTLNNWLALLVQLRDLNQSQIEQALIIIHDRTLQSTRNGLLGFGLSVITSFFGVWFVSKSIILPLKQLTHGLRTLSQGNYTNDIQVTSKDEFHDLAVAYNEMSGELREQENLRADFIATLSHEIRTPLSSIKESVNIIAEEVLGEVNDKQHKFLTIASSELTRITELLNHLMHVSMLESRKSHTKVEMIDPIQLVKDCVKGFTSSAETKNITFKYDFQKNPGKIKGHKEELQQIFTNIIGNALKFSPADKEIGISVLKAENSGYVQFKISDEGPGIPENEKNLIFNKYYRSKSVRKHMDGVGLGLYISRRIIQAMGGTVTVSNNVNRGCSFSVTLPKA